MKWDISSFEPRKIKPKDLCYCGSGKEYRNCHMTRDTYKPDKRLIFDKKKYVNDWQKDTEYFYEQGYYNWMADCFFKKVNPEKILDIGCGNGNGIIELIKNEKVKNIISIEENEYCIDNAYKRLNEKGINVKIIKRNEPIFKEKGFFNTKFTGLNDFEFARVNIIQGDITHDKILQEYLFKQKFDAVTCWLIGTHDSFCYNIDYFESGAENNNIYDLIVLKQLFELSDIILNPKGYFNIVERGEVLYTQELMQGAVNVHKMLSSSSNIRLDEDIKFIEYKPLENGIAMTKNITSARKDLI